MKTRQSIYHQINDRKPSFSGCSISTLDANQNKLHDHDRENNLVSEHRTYDSSKKISIVLL